MNEAQAVTTHVSSNNIDLAIAGWLDVHSRSAKTLKAYVDTINQFRGELLRIGHDLDSDVRTIAMVAQRFASFTANPHKELASKSTRNLRLAILTSFYEYALARYLLAPMDDQGHIANPLKIVSREKIEPYQGIHWLEPEEAEKALQKIDRSTDLGKRDYALLAILLNTGRRLKEVAGLQWRHVRFKGQRITLTFEHCKRDKTMIDTLNVGNSRALLTWLHAYYGPELASLDKHAPLWVTLSRNTEQAGQPLGIQGIQQVCGKYLEAHTHITRHTFSQLMIRAGATLPELQARLDITTDKSTQSQDEVTMEFINEMIMARLKQMGEVNTDNFAEWLACWQVITQLRQTQVLLDIAGILSNWYRNGVPVYAMAK